MNITAGKVWTIKLNSGEELVTRVTDISEVDLTLHDPLAVAPGPQGVGLIPCLFTADPKGETKLNKSAISVYALTDESIRNKYIQATSNLIVPETKKLILC